MNGTIRHRILGYEVIMSWDRCAERWVGDIPDLRAGFESRTISAGLRTASRMIEERKVALSDLACDTCGCRSHDIDEGGACRCCRAIA